jgi:hypothetical protein
MTEDSTPKLPPVSSGRAVDDRMDEAWVTERSDLWPFHNA